MNTIFPHIKNVSPKLLSDDIKPFNPNNPIHVNEWKDNIKDMFYQIKLDILKKQRKEKLDKLLVLIKNL